MQKRSLITILFKSLRDVLKPKVLQLLILPFVGSLLLWTLITWLLWDWILSLGFKLYNVGLMQRLVEVLSPYFTMTQDPLVAVTAGAFIFMVILPSALVTALLITSVILVPIFVDELRKNEFPQIGKRSNFTLAGTWKALYYSALYIFMWIVLLPFCLTIPLGALVIPFVLLSWFNARFFVWEVMLEITSPQEANLFIQDNSKALFLVGLMTSPFYYVPLVNFIAPVIVSAVYSRYCLTRYSEVRAIKAG